MPIAFLDDAEEETEKIEVKPLIDTSCFRSYKAWEKEGKRIFNKMPREIQTQLLRETKFFQQMEGSKEPIKRQITRMIRRKGDDGKEYVIYTERWDGVDWLGRRIEKPVTERLEGIITKPDVISIINEKGQKTGKDVSQRKWITEYEIPWKGKETVDQLIAETGSDPERIIYTVRTSNRRDNTVNYEQFVSNDWVQANNIMMQDGGFELAYVENLKRKQQSQK